MRVQDFFASWNRKPDHHFVCCRREHSLARTLRRNQTPAETKLWRLLHRRLADAKFRRNHPIGNFFADFCCINSRLVVELDGGQHAEEAEVDYDRRRTEYLNSLGFTVLRFWNVEVLSESERVIEQIWEALNAGEAEPSP